MTQIKPGDTCLVIDGADGKHSPNKGKTVTVLRWEGEHSQYGDLWACQGEGLTAFQMGQYLAVSEACFPRAWLQKIEPEKLDTEDKKELEAT